MVSGIVMGQTPAQTRIGPFSSVLAGASVEVTQGPAVGQQVTTDAAGAFALAIPEGVFRLRFSRPGYQPVDSAPFTSTAGVALTVPSPTLNQSPWAIAGLITDTSGAPVAGAAITIDIGGAFFLTATGTTDAAGRYRIASTQPHFSTVAFSLQASGVQSILSRSIPCCAVSGDTAYDVTVVRTGG